MDSPVAYKLIKSYKEAETVTEEQCDTPSAPPR